MDAQQARTILNFMTQVWEGEYAATCKVLAAHRGQLAAYLRAMGSKVPAIYGGSADEPMKG
jgi:hypothetical protein